MEFLTNYGLFLAKTLTVVVAVLVVVGGIIALRLRQRDGAAGRFKIIELNAQYRDNRSQLEQAILPPKQWRTQQKLREKENKQAEKQPSDAVLRTFVLRFTGDMRASQVASLREEISTILSVARPAQDEVMVCLESGGGLVTAYGLARRSWRGCGRRELSSPLRLIRWRRAVAT